jgi:hypothetical protein
MEFESYLNQREHEFLCKLFFKYPINFEWKILDEMGLQWIWPERQYKIMDKKRWFLAKIKYGI